jgi:hypothetical protein
MATFAILVDCPFRRLVLAALTIPKRQHVPLTKFHNATGDYLEQAMRAPIDLTSHGRRKQCIADAAYIDRLELLARGKIIDALAITVAPTSAMPEAMKQRILATQPTPEEIASDRWNDED